MSVLRRNASGIITLPLLKDQGLCGHQTIRPARLLNVKNRNNIGTGISEQHHPFSKHGNWGTLPGPGSNYL
jgi:hypothetical protein